MWTIRLYFGVIRDSILNLPKLLILHNLTLIKTQDEGDGIKTLVFRSNRRLSYQAGQYGIWFHKSWVRGKPFRLFTVASAPEENVIRLSTYISNSDFKRKLDKLCVESRMFMLGPIGQFTITKILHKRVVFIAGGIGITPIRSLAKHIYTKSLPIKTTLIHTSREKHLFKNELIKCIDYPNFITRDELSETINKIFKANKNATYYISGPPKFVKSTRKLLLHKNIRRIKIDGFLGY